MLDAVNEDNVGFGIIDAQREYLLVRGRPVRVLHVLPVGEFDDDHVARPAVFDHLDLTAMDDEAPAERCQHGIDLYHPWTGRDVAHIGYGVSLHDMLLHLIEVVLHAYTAT